MPTWPTTCLHLLMWRNSFNNFHIYNQIPWHSWTFYKHVFTLAENAEQLCWFLFLCIWDEVLDSFMESKHFSEFIHMQILLHVCFIISESGIKKLHAVWRYEKITEQFSTDYCNNSVFVIISVLVLFLQLKCAVSVRILLFINLSQIFSVFFHHSTVYKIK